MPLNKLSIIIPAYNEAATIHFILNKVIAVKLINDIMKRAKNWLERWVQSHLVHFEI
jgi:glycosyltransferase involved in cell wall biosynthesis